MNYQETTGGCLINFLCINFKVPRPIKDLTNTPTATLVIPGLSTFVAGTNGKFNFPCYPLQ
jgi:hypothetical protein